MLSSVSCLIMDANTPLKQYDEIDVSNLVRFGVFCATLMVMMLMFWNDCCSANLLVHDESETQQKSDKHY